MSTRRLKKSLVVLCLVVFAFCLNGCLAAIAQILMFLANALGGGGFGGGGFGGGGFGGGFGGGGGYGGGGLTSNPPTQNSQPPASPNDSKSNGFSGGFIGSLIGGAAGAGAGAMTMSPTNILTMGAGGALLGYNLGNKFFGNKNSSTGKPDTGAIDSSIGSGHQQLGEQVTSPTAEEKPSFFSNVKNTVTGFFSSPETGKDSSGAPASSEDS